MRFPHRRQINDWYCGPATLQMILSGFGIRASQEALARTSGTNERHGTPRAGLLRALRAHGLRGSARHGRGLEELDAAVLSGKAVIVLYVEKEADEGHYAVFLGTSRGRVLLNDPWHGARYALKRGEFLKRWRGSAKRWTRWALVVGR